MIPESINKLGRNRQQRRHGSSTIPRCCGHAILTVFVLLWLQSAGATERIGLVLMHGKTGSPAQLQELAARLTAAGYSVERPEMCWSRRRIYDRSYLDCLTDADAAAAKLKARGATTIVIAGMSLGGNAALAYGARRPDLKGVIALAPAPSLDRIRLRPEIARSISAAEAMVAAGRGDESTVFADVNIGRDFEVKTTPTIYLSSSAATRRRKCRTMPPS